MSSPNPSGGQVIRVVDAVLPRREPDPVHIPGLCALFADQFGVGHARIRNGDHDEVHPIKGKAFRHWLTLQLFLQDGKVPRGGELHDLCNLYEALASRKRQELANRIWSAEDRREVWLDLCDARWRAVRIIPGHWEVVAASPNLFHRQAHQRALPEPDCNGRLQELLSFLPPLSEQDGLLTLAWVTAALVPVPRPMLLVLGPQGSGKTTMSERLRRLIDPSEAELFGRDKRADLPLILSQHAVPVFDNYDELTSREADLYCQAVTGRGIARRKLRTDAEEFILSFQRPIIFNGVDLPTNRADFLDRALILELERLGQGQYKTLAGMEAQFAAARPRLLGGLLNTLSRALVELPTTDAHDLTRMADFHHLGRAIAVALGRTPGQFDAAYRAALERQRSGTIEDATAQALLQFAQDVRTWEGDATVLYRLLCDTAKTHKIPMRLDQWPRSAAALGRRIDGLSETLAGHGVEVARKPRGKQRLIAVRLTEAAAEAEQRPEAPTPSSPLAPGRPEGYITHVLPDGCQFHEGRLPAELLWDEAAFEAAWALHPAAYHTVRTRGGPAETTRWQQAYVKDYRFAKTVNRAVPIAPLLKPLLAWAKAHIDPRLDGLLLNWYDGTLGHRITAHRDNTDDLVVGAPIVTVSFGEERAFRMRPWKKQGGGYIDFPAINGAVFVLPYDTNEVWTHEIPHAASQRGRRISVTVRAFLASVPSR